MDKRFDPKLQPDLDEKFTMNRFKDKLAVVTGGASGVGFATVYRLAHDGAKVLILDTNEAAGKEVSEHLTDKHNRNVFFRKCDVSNYDECNDVISNFVNQNNTKKIDILVTCSLKFDHKGLQSTPENYSETMSVNVTGISNMTQACMPHFSKDGVSIVNIASALAQIAVPDKWAYSASKAAIVQLTRNMALDLATKNIRVNSVSPGWIWTISSFPCAPGGSYEKLQKITNNCHLVPTLCMTTQVASVIAFLCSKDASYITGANIPVDGGYTAMGPEGKGTKFD